MQERVFAFLIVAPFAIAGCWLAWWAIKPFRSAVR
jgi:drug/metabolite transporter superfamily protein YnfA